MYESIRLEIDDPIATVILNRPDQLNALTAPMQLELQHAFGEVERDSRVVGVLLTGEGRGFCAGADMQMLEQATEAGGFDVSQGALQEVSRPGADLGDDFDVGYGWLLSFRKPVIAAINGPCAGLGFAIAMLCDLRFASDRAVFTTAFANRGLIAEHGTSWILPRLVGPAHALDLLWSGRKVDGTEAERIGLVNRTVPHDDLLDEARGYLRMLAERSAPRSLMVMKQQVYKHLMKELGPSYREADELMVESLGRDDFREGVRSFLEKRPPRFERVGD
jgi:enoyl-CoA hydratase/carnithine racemase